MARLETANALSSQYDIDTGKHGVQFAACYLPHPLNELASIERDRERHVGRRVPIEPGLPGGKQDIAALIRSPHVAGQGHAQHRGDATIVKGVALHHQHRPSIARCRADRLAKVRPPDLALCDHPSSAITIRVRSPFDLIEHPSRRAAHEGIRRRVVRRVTVDKGP